ncbi:hypothetical protein NVS55_28425 [Myxococcus stipitatus]|uniref:hypothetical protein n=1 Tax=Myxococcus stipitatus TaxID=83455 RepID=UPI003144EE90
MAFSDNACAGGAHFVYTVPAGAEGNDQLRAGCASNTRCTGTVAWTLNPPTPGSGTLVYHASNTHSASVGTVNKVLIVTAGQPLTLGTCGVTGATFSGDTYLRLFGPTGQQVAFSDDACGGVGSNFVYTVPLTGAGSYQLRAGCYSNNTCGGTVAWTLR